MSQRISPEEITLPKVTKTVIDGNPVITVEAIYKHRKYLCDMDQKIVIGCFPLKDFDLFFEALCAVKETKQFNRIELTHRGSLSFEYPATDGKIIIGLSVPLEEETTYCFRKSIVQLKDENAKLIAENEKLKKQLFQIKQIVSD